MFPWVYGFHWSPGYLVFLGLFFLVALAVAIGLITAALRSYRSMKNGKAALIQWHSTFEDLPAADRACRHAITGELTGRVCERGFDCRGCEKHAQLLCEQPKPAAAAITEPKVASVLGLPVPLDRFYHRGHTWVQIQEDGTALVGLDEFGRRLFGPPDSLILPPTGADLRMNAPAWEMHKNGSSVRVLSPIDGTVVDSGYPDEPWVLRIKPRGALATSHLLRGQEVSAWYLREMERLQLSLSGSMGSAALADGGVLVEDASNYMKPEDWDLVCGEIFLES